MFLYSKWLRTPINTRHAIAKQFNIPKKGATEVSNNEVVKDGYFIEDIEKALNMAALQKYIGTGLTDFDVLWENLILRAEGKTMQVAVQVPAPEPPKPPQMTQEPPKTKVEDLVKIPKRRGRPPKTPRA